MTEMGNSLRQRFFSVVSGSEPLQRAGISIDTARHASGVSRVVKLATKSCWL